MAYDEDLLQQADEILQAENRVVFKKGGICFLLHGNMACGIINEDLIARVKKENCETSLKKSHTAKFDFTGRPMTGWVTVSPAGYESDDALTRRLRCGIDTAPSLPPK